MRPLLVLPRLGLVAALALAGCSAAPPQAVGTLEWDRITLPAPVSERIAAIGVTEGQTVQPGQVLLQLEAARSRARLDAAEAVVEQARQRLAELRAGARDEDQAAAQARVEGAQAQARRAEQDLARVRALVGRRLLAASELDRAEAAVRGARAELQAAQAQRELLRNGSRAEQVAQAEAALVAAQAQARALAVDLERVEIRAPRAGRIDSLPYEIGDQPPPGAPLAVLLVGATPYARVYVPEPLRADLRIGGEVRIRIHGHDRAYTGRVRALRSEPSFTPYFALGGEDASRLSYLAEIELGDDAAGLPAGLPVSAEWDVPER